MNLEKRQQHKAILLDASSAILLAKADFHNIVATSYRILMPESVFIEVTRKSLAGSGEYRQLLEEERLAVIPVSNPPAWCMNDASLQTLDRGERDTILLFFEERGDFVVTDDGAAARFCLNKKIPFVNSLLLLRLLHLSGKIDETSFKAGFASLLDLGRYSEKVSEYASNCADSELIFFLP